VRLNQPIRLVVWDQICQRANAQIYRYVFFGSLAVLLHLIVLTVLHQVFGVASVLATSVGFVCGVFANYFMQREFTFRSSARHQRAFPLFVLSALVGLAVNAFLFGLFNLVMHFLPAQIIVSLLVFGMNYTFNKLLTFRA